MNFKNMGSDGKDGGRPPVGAGGLPAGLARQTSIYSLTLDEFQNSLGGLGKDFGSMNMDEFLRNIWTAEETQAMASATAMGLQEAAGGSGLQRQGSLTLPRTLSQKTVDEVWRDLFKESCGGGGGGGGGGQGSGAGSMQPQRRQPTLGEMTLEEFLVRAGVVREEIAPAERPMMMANNNTTNNSVFYGDLSGANSNNNMGLALGFPPTSRAAVRGTVPQPVPNNSTANMAVNGRRPPLYASPMQLGNNNEFGNQLLGTRDGGIVGIGDQTVNSGMVAGTIGLGGTGVTATGSPANPLSSDGFGKSNGDLSSLSPVPYVFNRGLSKKCGGVEKVVERRQRRMIKNRESAARSRARKQAYTMELEAEVAKIKEQNQELQKKQAEILEMQKIQQVLEKINQERGPKKRCLRRTQTGPW